MKKTKDPAFLFYPQDFLVGTMTLSDKQVGQYIKLLCLQHAKGGKLTEKDMLKITKIHDDEIFEKFIVDDQGNYFNQRLLDEVNKRLEHSKKQKENIQKRWNKDGNTKMIPPYTIGRTEDIPLENEDENEDENEIKITKNSSIKKKKKEFIPPTLEEIKDYRDQRKSKVDPQAFYDYFTEGKWIDSEGKKVFNWKQKFITWERRETKGKESKSTTEPEWMNEYIDELSKLKG